MQKYLSKIILFFSFIMLSSCFEVVEEITINNDGSGNILMTVNFSKSKSKINSLMLLDSVNGYKVPSKHEIETRIANIKKQLLTIKGVSKIQTSLNLEDYVFSVSCNFTNVDVLNKVISNFNNNKNITNNRQFNFNKKTKTFTRTYNYDLRKEVQKVNKKDQEILKDASVTTIYRFQSPILTSRNKLGKISKNRKAIMLRVEVSDMLANRQNIKNTIKLK